MNSRSTRCNRCLLSTDYPGISFNREGTCSICLQYERCREQVKQYFSGMADFHRLMEKAQGTGSREYDCMLLYSGGKDSTYVLYRLVDLGLKVLAFTFDNGYISAVALDNIKHITSSLGRQVDSRICKAEHMAEIFTESLKSHYTVCTGCFKVLTAISSEMAVKEGINMIITGLSPGQIIETKLWGLYRQGVTEVGEIEKKLRLFRKIYHSTDDRLSRLLNSGLKQEDLDAIGFVDFFRYDETTLAEIREYLKGKGWVQPVDTGCCSTNCRINDVGIYIHLKEKGYHNYAAPLSWDCRLGKITREEGLKELSGAIDTALVETLLEEIGYYRPLIATQPGESSPRPESRREREKILSQFNDDLDNE